MFAVISIRISNSTRSRFLIETFFNWINKLWTETNQLPQISTRCDTEITWNFQEIQTVAQIPSLRFLHSPHTPHSNRDNFFLQLRQKTTHETRRDRNGEENEAQTNGKIKQHVIVVYDWMEQHGFGDVELDTWRRLFWGFFFSFLSRSLALLFCFEKPYSHSQSQSKVPPPTLVCWREKNFIVVRCWSWSCEWMLRSSNTTFEIKKQKCISFDSVWLLIQHVYHSTAAAAAAESSACTENR